MHEHESYNARSRIDLTYLSFQMDGFHAVLYVICCGLLCQFTVSFSQEKD